MIYVLGGGAVSGGASGAVSAGLSNVGVDNFKHFRQENGFKLICIYVCGMIIIRRGCGVF